MSEALSLSLEEFAAKRRKAQDDAVASLASVVGAWLTDREDDERFSRLMAAVGNVYVAAYEDDFGDTPSETKVRRFLDSIEEAVRRSTSSTRAQTLATWLAIAAINQAAVQAAEDDPEDLFLQWVTMGDKDVRHAHKVTEGQTRPLGESFNVDGTAMPYPGWPGAPIELWINCRCTLRPVLATQSALTAGGDMADEPINESVPWHGVLAPEMVKSGDGRMFGKDSLSTRPLPLPLTWQKQSSAGHDGNVTVAKIEKAEMRDGMMYASGHFIANGEADECIGLLGEFGRFGVSVDADDVTFELDDEEETVVFSKARVSSACIVSIPAFAEAWVALGEAPWEQSEEAAPEEATLADRRLGGTYDDLAASLAAMSAKVTDWSDVEQFVDVAPGKTEDGPGWLTHPVDTDRLRDYWVRGPGAAKIGWGTPGDFNRCRIAVAQYVKPQYLNGYCANRHYDALGFWPGRPVSGDVEMFKAEGHSMAPGVSLVAAGGWCAPSDWFCDPKFEEVTPLKVTEDGRVFGHLAAWDSCHIGPQFIEQDICQAPPRSMTGYSYFLTGEVITDTGEAVSVGQVTIGGGHAAPRLGVRGALAHYDSTSSVVCDVNIGEDEFGIWIAGSVRPGVSDEMIYALRASALSGDWRMVRGNLELVAALAVNVPGFGVPRTQIAAANMRQISLVASGVVAPDLGEANVDVRIDYEALGRVVAEQVVALQERKDRMLALSSILEGDADAV